MISSPTHVAAPDFDRPTPLPADGPRRRAAVVSARAAHTRHATFAGGQQRLVDVVAVVVGNAALAAGIRGSRWSPRRPTTIRPLSGVPMAAAATGDRGDERLRPRQPRGRSSIRRRRHVAALRGQGCQQSRRRRSARVREHERLMRLHATLPPAIARGIPEPLGSSRWPGRTACVQSCAPGPLMNVAVGAGAGRWRTAAAISTSWSTG